MVACRVTPGRSSRRKKKASAESGAVAVWKVGQVYSGERVIEEELVVVVAKAVKEGGGSKERRKEGVGNKKKKKKSNLKVKGLDNKNRESKKAFLSPSLRAEEPEEHVCDCFSSCSSFCVHKTLHLHCRYSTDTFSCAKERTTCTRPQGHCIGIIAQKPACVLRLGSNGRMAFPLEVSLSPFFRRTKVD